MRSAILEEILCKHRSPPKAIKRIRAQRIRSRPFESQKGKFFFSGSEADFTLKRAFVYEAGDGFSFGAKNFLCETAALSLLLFSFSLLFFGALVYQLAKALSALLIVLIGIKRAAARTQKHNEGESFPPILI